MAWIWRFRKGYLDAVSRTSEFESWAKARKIMFDGPGLWWIWSIFSNSAQFRKPPCSWVSGLLGWYSALRPFAGPMLSEIWELHQILIRPSYLNELAPDPRQSLKIGRHHVLERVRKLSPQRRILILKENMQWTHFRSRIHGLFSGWLNCKITWIKPFDGWTVSFGVIGNGLWNLWRTLWKKLPAKFKCYSCPRVSHGKKGLGASGRFILLLYKEIDKGQKNLTIEKKKKPKKT